MNQPRLLIVIIFTIFNLTSPAPLNYKPVIGIFTQPAQSSIFKDQGFAYPEYQYVLSPYVDFIVQTGARAIPIQFDGSEEYIRKMMDQVNGILFTGGGIDIQIEKPIKHSGYLYNIFTKNAQLIMDIAIEKNDNGQNFGVWGTCQGLQLMAYIQSGLNYDIIQVVENDEDESRNGYFNQNSRMFKDMSHEIIDYVYNDAPLYYYHELYVTNKTFNIYKSVKDFFKVTGWSYNSTSAENPENLFYVAAMESYQYPFYAVQFHPEYTQFLWTPINTNRSPQSIYVSQFLANFFTQVTRYVIVMIRFFIPIILILFFCFLTFTYNHQQFENKDYLDKLFFQNHPLVKIQDYNYGNGYFYLHSDFKWDENQKK